MSDGIAIGARLVLDGDEWVEAGPFVLPDEIATEAFALLGARGSGKSNAGVVVAEEFTDRGIPWVAIDPKGDWWGIRSSADGEGPGLPVPILGGIHGDVLVADSEGAQWADVLFDNDLTAVVDVSDFTKAERGRFLLAFFDRLYLRHRREPRVRCVLCEEAHEFIPQSVGREDGKLKESASRVALLGRSFGLGCGLFSQRSARLHNDVLTQVGTLAPMRTSAPADKDAIKRWVQEHQYGSELIASLPHLSDGEGWLWSPEFLGAVERVQWRRRRTFDSGATPKVGAKRVQPRTLADVDLAAIKEQMAESVERAQRDDPKHLRAQLARAEARVRELEMWEPPPPVVGVSPQVVRAKNATISALAEAARRMQALCEAIDESMEAPPPTPPPAPAPPPPPPALRTVPRPEPSGLTRVVHDGWAPSPNTAPAKVLAVLARAYPDGLAQRRAGFLAGVPSRKSTFRNAVSALRTNGLIEDAGGLLRATLEGVHSANVDELPTGPELLAYWRGKLTGAPRTVFEVLLAHGGGADLSLEELHDASGIPAGVSTMRNALSTLRAHGLVTEGTRSLDPDFMESTRG